MKGVPMAWFRSDALSEDEANAVIQDQAKVAQKCTGRAKKPVFLFPDKVVKGSWKLLSESGRLNCELGRAALIRIWAMPETSCSVLKSVLFAHPDNQRIYIVTPALYPPPSSSRAWVIESKCESVSAVGPRFLEVVSRASTGAIRVSDRVREEPQYLLDTPEIWEHLIHRCILQCGDSGLHNMMVNPKNNGAVGVDLDEQRNTKRENPDDWLSLLFKRAPAKKIQPYLNESLHKHQDYIQRVLSHLSKICFEKGTNRILQECQLEQGNWKERIGWLQSSLSTNK